MLKRSEVMWAVVSKRVWEKLEEEAKKEQVPVTKLILRILFETFDYSKEIQNDYAFSSRTGHKIMARLTASEKRRLEELAATNGTTICQLVRNILYTHFFKDDK